MRASVIVALLLPRLMLAQQPASVTLKPANGALKERLAGVSSTRELSDGRVIFTNGRDNLMVVADFKSGKVERIGQIPGSSDFLTANLLGTLAGDTSYMVNRSTKGWTILDGTRVLGELPATSPLIVAVPYVLFGTSQDGHLLSVLAPHLLATEPLHSLDSGYVVRVDHSTAQQDTLTHIAAWEGPGKIIRKGDTVDAFNDMRETAYIARDGWVAILRKNPYRMDWWSPDGKMIRGAPIPYVPTALDTVEKMPYLTRFGPIANPPAGWGTPQVRWPAAMPPFEGSGGMLVTADGLALVTRLHPVAETGKHYDVIDRRGVLVGRMVIPDSIRVLGFGAHSVYTSSSNDAGMLVERHPWP